MRPPTASPPSAQKIVKPPARVTKVFPLIPQTFPTKTNKNIWQFNSCNLLF